MDNFSIITGTIFGYEKDKSKVLIHPKSLNPDSYSELQGEKVIPCEYFRENTETKHQYKKGDPCVVLCVEDSPFSSSFYLLGVLAGGNFPVSEKYNKKFLEDYKIEIDEYKLIIKKEDKPVVEISGDKITISQNEKKKIEITEDLIQFDDGQNNGLVKVDVLKEYISKTNQILNAILTVINGTPINEPGNGAPSALQTVLKTSLAGKNTEPATQIENDKVKH